MTIGHKIKLIPARMKWLVKDLVGIARYSREYYGLKDFVGKLEQEYLMMERQKLVDDPETRIKKAEFNIAQKILTKNY